MHLKLRDASGLVMRSPDVMEPFSPVSRLHLVVGLHFRFRTISFSFRVERFFGSMH